MSVPNNSTCPYCKLPLREYHDFITCPSCETSYHEKCWEENGGCYSCSIVTGTADSEAIETLSWYLYHGNRNLGPLTWEELCSQPEILPDDLVWNSRLPDWIRADQIPNLPLGTGSPVSTEPEEIESTALAGDSVIAKKVSAAPAGVEEQRAAPPDLPDSTLQWQQDGTTLHFDPSPAPVRETGAAAAAGDSALQAADEHTALPPPPEDGVIKWKLAETAASRRSKSSEPSGEGTESLSRDPARAERILSHLYEDEPADSLPEPSFLDRKEDYYDERLERASRYARHIVYGILLALTGIAAGGAVYLYAAHWENMYHTGALAISGAISLFGIVDFFRGLLGWLKYRG